MSKIIEVVKNVIRPYYYYIIVILALILVAIIAKYAYTNYYLKKQTKFNDVANANRRNKVVNIFFFHVDWCPHCKTALPEWNKFMNQYDGEEINGYMIACVDINCTNETSEVTTAINKYGIESYPTVKMLKDEKIIEFDSKISSTALQQFAMTMLND